MSAVTRRLDARSAQPAAQGAVEDGEDASPSAGADDAAAAAAAAAAANQQGDRPATGPGALVPAMRTVVSDLAHALCTQACRRLALLVIPILAVPCKIHSTKPRPFPHCRSALHCIASAAPPFPLWGSLLYPPMARYGGRLTQLETCKG